MESHTDTFSFKFIELFAGIGGFALGLESIGGQCVWACELNPASRLTYKVNFGFSPYYDITKADLRILPQFDMLTAGFPCQDFSTLGDQKGLEGERGKLFFQIIRVMRECKPRAVLLENVKGLLTMNDGQAMQKCVQDLESEGYHVTFKVINSKTLVPQYRNRVYIVAFKENSDFERFEFLESPVLSPPRRINDILHDEVEEPFLEHWKLSLAAWKGVKRSKTAMKYGIEKRLCLRDALVSDTLVSNYRNSRTSVAQFVAPEGYTKGGVVGTRPRWFSPRECARLMGFPETFQLHPKETLACEQLGNAVVPPTIALVGGAVISALERSRTKRIRIRDSACRASLRLCINATGARKQETLIGKQVMITGAEVSEFEGKVSDYVGGGMVGNSNPTVCRIPIPEGTTFIRNVDDIGENIGSPGSRIRLLYLLAGFCLASLVNISTM